MKHSIALEELTSGHARALASARDEAVATLGASHSSDLDRVKVESEASVTRLREAHAAEIESLTLAKDAVEVRESHRREAEVAAIQLELEASQAVSFSLVPSSTTLCRRLDPLLVSFG